MLCKKIQKSAVTLKKNLQVCMRICTLVTNEIYQWLFFFLPFP